MDGFLTTLEAAEKLRLEEWQVRRIFTEGDLPEPGKFGGKRCVPEFQLPAIREAAVARGWLKPVEVPA